MVVALFLVLHLVGVRGRGLERYYLGHPEGPPACQGKDQANMKYARTLIESLKGYQIDDSTNGTRKIMFGIMYERCTGNALSETGGKECFDKSRGNRIKFPFDRLTVGKILYLVHFAGKQNGRDVEVVGSAAGVFAKGQKCVLDAMSKWTPLATLRREAFMKQAGDMWKEKFPAVALFMKEGSDTKSEVVAQCGKHIGVKVIVPLRFSVKDILQQTCIPKAPKDGLDQLLLKDSVREATAMREIYHDGYKFPEWSIKMLEEGKLEEYQKTVVVYYNDGDDYSNVRRMAHEREPMNMALVRHFDDEKLFKKFGYSHGAYKDSTKRELMPNIAIYCKTPVRWEKEQKEIHVINVVGFWFDSKEQPDYKFFSQNWGRLVESMAGMWRFVFECAHELRLKYIYLADVGGGAFSAELPYNYTELKDKSLGRVNTHDIEVEKLPRVPNSFFEGREIPKERVENSLMVNAWDPWSMVGNGNEGDNSLDGFFGRSTAMAVLCWPETNPHIQFKPVKTPLKA